MQALEITDVRGCMAKLLMEGTFDRMQIAEAAVTSMVTFTLDGHLVRAFYTDDEWKQFEESGYTCVPFGRVRKICLEMIRGRKTPVSFRFIFLAPPAAARQLLGSIETVIRPEEVEALSMNLVFRGGKLSMTTGTSLRVFTPDKSLEQAWDAYSCRFLSDNKIEWSKMT